MNTVAFNNKYTVNYYPIPMCKWKIYDEILKKLCVKKLTMQFTDSIIQHILNQDIDIQQVLMLIELVFSCISNSQSYKILNPGINLLDFIFNYLESQLADVIITDPNTVEKILDISLSKIIYIMPHETQLFIILFIKKFTDANISLISQQDIETIKNYIVNQVENVKYTLLKPFKSQIYAIIIMWIQLQNLITYYNISDQQIRKESSYDEENKQIIDLYVNWEFFDYLLNKCFLQTPNFEDEEISQFICNIGMYIKPNIIKLYTISNIINYETLLAFINYISVQLINLFNNDLQIKNILVEYTLAYQTKVDNLDIQELQEIIIEISYYTMNLHKKMTLNSLTKYFQSLLQICIQQKIFTNSVLDQIYNLLCQFDQRYKVYIYLKENDINPILLLEKVDSQENVMTLVQIISDNLIEQLKVKSLQISNDEFCQTIQSLIDKIITIQNYQCTDYKVKNNLLYLFGLYLEYYDNISYCTKIIEYLKQQYNFLNESFSFQLKPFIQRYDLENYKVKND